MTRPKEFSTRSGGWQKMAGNMGFRHLMAAALFIVIMLGGCMYMKTPRYTAGRGRGSATSDTAMKAMEELSGSSYVEKLADLSGLVKGENPAEYLAGNSIFVLDISYMAHRVDADRLSMESEAGAFGYSYSDYLVGQCGYASVEEYENGRRKLYERFVKERLAVYEAAKKKNITISVEEYRSLLSEYAERFGYGADTERFERECEKDSIANEMLYDKTLAQIRI